ncbi:NUDIX hydrolase [Bacteroidota bacterium]
MIDMEQRPKVGVGVIINNDNKVLLLQRKNAHGEGTWCFPGGHLEFNEEIEDCVKREVEEETGIQVQNIRFAGLTNDLFKDEGKHYITIFMICNYESGEAQIKEPEKCTNMNWFDWSSLPRPLFLPIENLLKQGYKP